MFHKKIQKDIESMKDTVKYNDEWMRERYYALRADFDHLVEALGLSKREIHKVEYVKKGGPEAP